MYLLFTVPCGFSALNSTSKATNFAFLSNFSTFGYISVKLFIVTSAIVFEVMNVVTLPKFKSHVWVLRQSQKGTLVTTMLYQTLGTF